MAVALVVRLGLDGVADGVAQVEHHPAPGVPLIRGHNLDLGPRAVEDYVAHRRRVEVLDGPDPGPERVAGDQSSLDYLHEAGGELLMGKGRQGCGIGQDGDRHMERADVVLRRWEIDSGLA